MSDYPCEHDMEKIRAWSFKSTQDFKEFMKFIRSIWKYAEAGYWEETKRRRYRISTGGWSGNEDIIGAMQENQLFWTMASLSWKRGGHYEFEIPALKSPRPTKDPS